MSPLSSTGVLGSNLIYNSRNQGELGANMNLPERPDQPECRYYMNTGTCKYGSDCKFHHPKERINPSSGNSIGPLGLPSRPVSTFIFTLCGLITTKMFNSLGVPLCATGYPNPPAFKFLLVSHFYETCKGKVVLLPLLLVY